MALEAANPSPQVNSRHLCFHMQGSDNAPRNHLHLGEEDVSHLPTKNIKSNGLVHEKHERHEKKSKGEKICYKSFRAFRVFRGQMFLTLSLGLSWTDPVAEHQL